MPWAFAAVAIVAAAQIATRNLTARMLVLRSWGYARLGFLPRVSRKFPNKLINRSPANDAHEGVDVTCCLGAEVECSYTSRASIGVPPCERVTMVGRPL